jgi:hypothetical protein
MKIRSGQAFREDKNGFLTTNPEARDMNDGARGWSCRIPAPHISPHFALQ